MLEQLYNFAQSELNVALHHDQMCQKTIKAKLIQPALHHHHPVQPIFVRLSFLRIAVNVLEDVNHVYCWLNNREALWPYLKLSQSHSRGDYGVRQFSI
jgi:hypothetical protein